MLSKTDRAGLLGVMFDFLDELPRQGAAVFVDEIRSRFDESEVPRRVLATAMHELGHCLNLTHRFTREVGRTDSTSIMNYDWLYKGGNRVNAYWDKFNYTFDEDELEFLRHAPRDEVVPGGAPLRISSLLVDCERRGAQPEDQRTVEDLQLWLTPPPIGTSFAYGQPVYLEVSLRNVGELTWCLPRHALDVKAGMLEILIQRRARAPRWIKTEGREPFTPFMRRCFDVDAADRIALRPRESLHENVSFTFGSAGAPFAEPGDYLLTPVLTLYDEQSGGIEGVVEGADLLITVRAPVSGSDERDAEVLRRADVGASLALGGADCFGEAAETLRGLVERRRADGSGEPDGVVAAATRMLGIRAARRGQPQEAVRLLSAVLEPAALATLDPHTAAHTRQLASRQAAAPKGKNTTAYVDLAVRTGSGRLQTRAPIRGVLISRKPDRHSVDDRGEGVAVLINAPGVAGEEVARASAVFSAQDGVTERVSIRSIETFGKDSEDGTPLALALLARTVPSSGPTPLDLHRLWQDRIDSGSYVRSVIAESGISLPANGAEDQVLAEMGPVVSAERDAPSGPPRPGGGDKIPQNPHAWRDVAGWWCRLTNRCGEAPPGSPEPPNPDREFLPQTRCDQSEEAFDSAHPAREAAS